MCQLQLFGLKKVAVLKANIYLCLGTWELRQRICAIGNEFSAFDHWTLDSSIASPKGDFRCVNHSHSVSQQNYHTETEATVNELIMDQINVNIYVNWLVLVDGLSRYISINFHLKFEMIER